MKWYNYKLRNINIYKCFGINVGINIPVICFLYDTEKFESIEYSSFEERDAEFEKIKVLMGINDKKNDWTPGRCC